MRYRANTTTFSARVRRDPRSVADVLDRISTWYHSPLSVRGECGVAAAAGTAMFLLFVLAAAAA